MFELARKSVSTTWNEAFVEKYATTIDKFCFFWQENQKNSFQYQENVF